MTRYRSLFFVTLIFQVFPLVLFAQDADGRLSSSRFDGRVPQITLEFAYSAGLHMMKPDLKEAFDQSGFSGTPDYPEWIPAPIRFSYPVYKWELRPASLSIRVGLLPRFSAGVMAYRSPGYRAKGIGRETERLFADHASLVGMISLNPIPASHRYKAFRTETWLLFGAGITSATANLHVTGVESDDPPVDKSVETIVPHLLAGGEAHIHLGAIVSMVVRGSFVIPQRMDLPKVRNGEKELVAHSVNLTTFHVTGGLLFRLWFLGG